MIKLYKCISCDALFESPLKYGICHDCHKHTTLANKDLVCKKCQTVCQSVSDGLCSKCAENKRATQIYKNPRVKLECKRCGMSFFGVDNTVQFCSLICQADNMAHCEKCNTVLTTNSDIAIQLCKACGGRKKRTPCSKCHNRVDITGIFKIDGEDLCGTCVGKHFEEKLEEQKVQDVIKKSQSTKHRRIILD